MISSVIPRHGLDWNAGTETSDRLRQSQLKYADMSDREIVALIAYLQSLGKTWQPVTATR